MDEITIRQPQAKGQQPWLERRAAVSKIGDEADACREAVRTGVQGHYECCFEDGLVIPAVLAQFVHVRFLHVRGMARELICEAK